MKTLTLMSLGIVVILTACGKEKNETLEPTVSEYPASVRVVVREDGREDALIDETKALEMKAVGDTAALKIQEEKYQLSLEIAEVEKSNQSILVQLSGGSMKCETLAYGKVALEIPLVKLHCQNEKESIDVSIFNNEFWNEKSGEEKSTESVPEEKE